MLSGSERQDIIQRNCDEFLQESMSQREAISCQQTGHFKKLNMKKKNQKDYRAQIKGISKKEIHRRAIARECQCCAWYLDRPGAHQTTRWVNSQRYVQWTAPSLFED